MVLQGILRVYKRLSFVLCTFYDTVILVKKCLSQMNYLRAHTHVIFVYFSKTDILILSVWDPALQIATRNPKL